MPHAQGAGNEHGSNGNYRLCVVRTFESGPLMTRPPGIVWILEQWISIANKPAEAEISSKDRNPQRYRSYAGHAGRNTIMMEGGRAADNAGLNAKGPTHWRRPLSTYRFVILFVLDQHFTETFERPFPDGIVTGH